MAHTLKIWKWAKPTKQNLQKQIKNRQCGKITQHNRISKLFGSFLGYASAFSCFSFVYE